MAIATFDALAYARKLEGAGFSREQAEIQAEAFRSFAEIQDAKNLRELATKGDIQNLRLEMKEMEMRLSESIVSGKHEMLKWLIGLLLTQSALIVAIFALLK